MRLNCDNCIVDVDRRKGRERRGDCARVTTSIDDKCMTSVKTSVGKSKT
jgi:hypothetical protein